MTAEHLSLKGIGVSPGIATGPAVRVEPAVVAPSHEPAPADPAAAGAQVRAALDQVAQTLDERAQRAPKAALDILAATAMMARDPGLATEVDAQLAAGRGAANALAAAIDIYIEKFEALGGPMAERVSDLRDVRDRATARLLGLAEPGIPDLVEPSVLVAHDLAPAETATLDPAQVLGIVIEAGGPTSHTAILAGQLGIPAVVQAVGAADIQPGTRVALDGSTGEVIVEPTPAETHQLTDRSEHRAALVAVATGGGHTHDGYPVPLLANIGTLEDALRAAETDAEGVGLFRTEFLFLDREDAPSLEEQTSTYTEVFSAFAGRRVVVRTLDAGSDKRLAFARTDHYSEHEDNPALGRRGLRLSQAMPELLDTQVSAIAAAARLSNADVRVMAPMVSTVEEAHWFANRVRSAGIPQVGVMIEVPAAALRARHVLREVDFASIGTNDLAQYALAADRGQGTLAGLLDPWQPALLDLIAAACVGGRLADVPVGACGEAAGDPALALVLVGLGVSSLSMSTGRISAVRAALATHDLTACEELAEAARREPTAADARETVLSLADQVLRELA